MIVWQRPNLLLLDEPTNHLDLTTREALGMALNEFEGTVLLVSHDRALLRAVCDEFWLVGRGQVQPFDGDLEDYQRYLLEESRRLRELARSAAAASEAPSAAGDAAPRLSGAEQRKQEAARRQQLAAQTRPLKKELETIEPRMAALESERSALEARLGEALQPAEFAEVGRRLKALGQELEALEERWLLLSEQLQEMQAAA